MKKIILCIMVFLLAVTSVFALQNIPKSSDSEALPIDVTEAPLPMKEPQKQPEEKIVEKTPQEPLPIKEEAINEVLVEEEIKQGTFCTIEIICNQVLENMEKLPDGKKEIVPTNGVILAKTKAEFYEDETVFNVTSRELKTRKIHIDFVYTPMYNSVYIKGINNLYEKDCGAGSGWVYTVNGQSTDCGSSAYKLKDGDEIQWIYILR